MTTLSLILSGLTTKTEGKVAKLGSKVSLLEQVKSLFGVTPKGSYAAFEKALARK